MVKDKTGSPSLGLARKIEIFNFSRSPKGRAKDLGKDKDQNHPAIVPQGYYRLGALERALSEMKMNPHGCS